MSYDSLKIMFKMFRMRALEGGEFKENWQFLKYGYRIILNANLVNTEDQIWRPWQHIPIQNPPEHPPWESMLVRKRSTWMSKGWISVVSTWSLHPGHSLQICTWVPCSFSDFVTNSIMVTPWTHLAKNHESQSRTIESQFKQQGVLDWKFTGLYVTKQLIWRQTSKLVITVNWNNVVINHFDVRKKLFSWVNIF